jgi:hypothetical protein
MPNPNVFLNLVIPAKAGIQGNHALRPLWIPAFAGMTNGWLGCDWGGARPQAAAPR